MAKNGSRTDGHRKDGHAVSGRFVDQKSDSIPFKGVRREILFPTEPSTIGHKKIDRAIERVVSRKK